jgi:hypothetical protein
MWGKLVAEVNQRKSIQSAGLDDDEQNMHQQLSQGIVEFRAKDQLF